MEDWQYAKYQSKVDAGPIPEGLFKFSTSINPKSSSFNMANDRFKNEGDEVLKHIEDGITYLPVDSDRKARFPNWGTMRVRLESDMQKQAARQGFPLFGRSGFYLHNSNKHFTHGCIEVGTTLYHAAFFDALLNYAAYPKRKATLTLRVRYAYPDQGTKGLMLVPQLG